MEAHRPDGFLSETCGDGTVLAVDFAYRIAKRTFTEPSDKAPALPVTDQLPTLVCTLIDRRR